MLTAAIVEDNPQEKVLLKSLLNNAASDIRIIGTSKNVKEAIQLIEREQPALVFLDVQLGNETGFEVLRKIKKRNFETIFTTGYEKHAMQALRMSAAGFVLKPIDKKLLAEAIHTARNRIQHSIQSENRNNILLHNLTNLPVQEKILMLKTKTEEFGVPLCEILYLCGDKESGVKFILKDKPGTTRFIRTTQDSISDYRDFLEPYHFCQIHRSHIVNLHLIRIVKSKSDVVEMYDGETLDIGFSFKEAFLKTYRQLLPHIQLPPKINLKDSGTC